MSNRLSERWVASWPRQASEDSEIGVVLVHGITGTPAEMRPLERHLQQLGYRVEVPLLAGHGAGHRGILASRWPDWLAVVRREVDKTAAVCQHVVCVGLSAGGLLALLAAVERPCVNGVVMLSVHFGIPGSRVSRFDYHLSRWLAALPFLRRHWYFIERPPYGLKDERLQRRITKAIEASKRGETEQYGLFRTYAETMHQVYLLEDKARRAAAQLRCPALLIHSVEDTMLDVENATTLYGLLGSREKAVTLLAGCDHVMTVDLQKELVAERVAAFIAQLAMVRERAAEGW